MGTVSGLQPVQFYYVIRTRNVPAYFWCAWCCRHIACSIPRLRLILITCDVCGEVCAPKVVMQLCRVYISAVLTALLCVVIQLCCACSTVYFMHELNVLNRSSAAVCLVLCRPHHRWDLVRVLFVVVFPANVFVTCTRCLARRLRCSANSRYRCLVHPDDWFTGDMRVYMYNATVVILPHFTSIVSTSDLCFCIQH
jgi:hypothetical protein